MSIRGWCRKHAVHEASFYWWRRRLGRQDADRREPAFVPVRMAENLSASVEPEIEILLAGERRVRVRGSVNRQALADVLAVLANGRGEAEARPC